MVILIQQYHNRGGRVTRPPYQPHKDAPNLHKGNQGREYPFKRGGIEIQ